MKQLIALLFLVATLPALAADSIDNKTMEKFRENFPHARKVKWYAEGDRTAVHFESGSVITNIWYNAEGEVIKTRRYYGEQDLAPYLKVKLSQKYPGKKIHGVTELSNANELFYVVTLEDANSWTQVRCETNGDMTRIQKLKKS
ncbi:MAG: hypothetical protein EOO09_02845 [Chitinophagaceae bacterium]|nr:MAG: hypothetical protein EOO09_02845 [Chitinophagaceae bacterium]